MFKIFNGRAEFFQWDLDQQLIIEDNSINEVHFCNRTDEYSIVCEVFEQDGLRLVNVPNILLQDNWDIKVYAYCINYTKVEEHFKVVARAKPADYIYTETEIKDYDDLKARVDEIEKNGVSQEAVNAAVSAYLTEHPIESGATAEEAAQIAQNKSDIAVLQSAASGYALKSEIPSIEGLATETYVDNAVNNVKVDLSGYALKTDIPTNVSEFTNDAGYATKAYVDNAIGSGGTIDLSNYYTKAEVDAKIPDVSGFITESEADTKINTAVCSAEERVDFKLGSYALKTEIPDVSGFATKAEISGFITEIPAEYVTETELNAKGYLTEIPTEYVTDSELAAKGYLTEHQSLEGYAKIIDIPDVSGYQTEAQVIALIQANMPASGDEVSY